MLKNKLHSVLGYQVTIDPVIVEIRPWAIKSGQVSIVSSLAGLESISKLDKEMALTPIYDTLVALTHSSLCPYKWHLLVTWRKDEIEYDLWTDWCKSLALAETT